MNNLQRSMFATLLLAIGLTLQQEVSALSTVSNFETKEYQQWQKSFSPHQYWLSNKTGENFGENKHTEIEVRVEPTGIIESMRLVHSSGFRDFDFSCLESIYNSGPLMPMPVVSHEYPPLPDGQTYAGTSVEQLQKLPNMTVVWTVVFDSTQKPKQWKAVDEYFSKHPKLINRAYPMHQIPLVVEKYFPNIFTMDELNQAEKIIAVRTDLDAAEINNRFNDDWQAFIHNHKGASKEEILTAAKSIKSRLSRYLASE